MSTINCTSDDGFTCPDCGNHDDLAETTVKRGGIYFTVDACPICGWEDNG